MVGGHLRPSYKVTFSVSKQTLNVIGALAPVFRFICPGRGNLTGYFGPRRREGLWRGIFTALLGFAVCVVLVSSLLCY